MDDNKFNRMFKLIFLLLMHGSLTGEHLSRMLKVSLRSVQRYIKQLNQLGFLITSRNCGYKRGYKLCFSPDLKKELVNLLYNKR